MSKREKVFMIDGDDKEMIKAYQLAQDTFKYFWRELSWEKRRIIPALDMACIKTLFRDDKVLDGSPNSEHMWLSDIDFNGIDIKGVLLNSPNWITNFKKGDSVTIKLNEITDWMYDFDDEIYGAYTVNLMRKRMTSKDRKAHDKAWGLKFGDPEIIKIVYNEPTKKMGIFGKLFSRKKEILKVELPIEHPMSLNIGDNLKEFLKKEPDSVSVIDEEGMTMLHREALAGNLAPLKILIEFGADTKLKTLHGLTAMDLAKILNWEHIIKFLSEHSS